MADKSVGELIAAQSVTPTDLFVLEQNGTAKKLTGQILENWLVSFADGHGGIQSIVKKGTSGLVDTYRITLADTTTFDFMVTNGKSIKSISKASTSGLVDTYRIAFNDGTSSTFTVTNGAKGDKGDNQYVWIKYASQKPTASSHSFGDVADNWIGIYSGASETAPTDWEQYEWFQIKGEKGDTGDPAMLNSSVVEYQVGDSGTVIPSGVWSASVPVVAQGKYLWTRTTNTFNTGNPVVSYSVSRMGLDGSGSVSSVANISPDENGNVPLTAADLNALPNTGGDLTGELRMHGQPISGLNPPTEDDQGANKGYVDTAMEEAKTYTNEQVKKAAPRNLLDNSDWRVKANIVNQRGKATYTGGSTTTYTIDRWSVGNSQSVVTLSDDGYLIFSCLDGSTNAYPKQQLENMGGKTVTGAICLSDGSKYIVNAVMPSTAPSALTGIAVGDVGSDGAKLAIACEKGSLTLRFQLTIPTGKSLYAKWAALYEGEYTAETLPEYQPKGYAAELLECQRYFLRLNDYVRYPVSRLYSGEIDFLCPLPIQMRVTPTISGQIDVYAGSTKQTGFTFIISGCGANALSFRAQKSNHGLTAADSLSVYPVGATLSADL